MLWFVLAFLTALFASLGDVVSKHNLKNIDEYIVSWSLRVFALPLLIPILFFIELPLLGNKFWSALIINGIINSVVAVLYMKALKSSDLSITTPMITFTPLFLLITSPILVGEFPDLFGFIGILLIVIGSYLLNIKERHKGYIEPFKVLLKEKGPKLMLVVAFLWSITANYDKIGVQNSSPLFWVIAVNIFIAIFMLPIVFYKSRKNLFQIKTEIKKLAPIGFLNAITLIFQMTAISLTLVAYVISIKRTSSLMGVLFGYLIFKEKGIKERLLGCLIMIVGVLFITLS